MRLRQGRRGKRGESSGDGLNRTDWYAAAAMVAKHAPGFGDPLRMPLDVFGEVIEAVSDMLNAEQGDSGRAAVDREMRRLLNE